jgi:uncharacterized membrane-anchored protein
MTLLEIIRLTLVVIHLIGLAAIIGPFLLQMRKKSGLEFRTMFTGAIVQVVTGVLLIAVSKTEAHAIIDAKMGVKLAIALLVLAAAIVAVVRQRRLVAAGESDRPVLPLLHVMGFLALANVIVAVVWH